MEVHVPVMRVLSMRGWSWDNCEADEADIRLVDKLRFPADQSFWNSLDRATWECAYAKEPPLSTVQSSLTPDQPLTINQYLLVSFVRAFERVNPLVVSIVSGETHCEPSDADAAAARGSGSGSRRPHKFRASADFWRAFLLYGSRTGRVYTQRTSFLQLEVSCRVSDTLPRQDSSNAVHYARTSPAEESVAAMAAAAEATGVRYVNAYEWSKFCAEWERSIGVCWDGEAHPGAESYDPYQDPDNWWYGEDGEAYYSGASADPSLPPQRYRWDYDKDAWVLEKPPPELVPPSSVLFSPDDVWVSVGRRDKAHGGGGGGGEKDGGAADPVVVHVRKGGSKADGGNAAEEGADTAAAAAAVESAENIVLLRRRLREQEDELAARGKQVRRLAGDVASLKLQQQLQQQQQPHHAHQRQQQQPTARRVDESPPAPTPPPPPLPPPPPPAASPGSSFLGAASERQDTLIREIEDGLHDWASSLHRTRHRRPEPRKVAPGAGTAAAVLHSLQQPSSAGLHMQLQQQSYASTSPMKSAVDAPVWGTAPTRRR